MSVTEEEIKEMSGEEIETLIRRLYTKARKIDPDTVLKLALEADNTEEKKFLAYIAMMNLEHYQEEQTERAFRVRMMKMLDKLEIEE